MTIPKWTRVLALACAAAALPWLTWAQPASDEAEPPAPAASKRGATMDYGPFLSYSVLKRLPASPPKKPATAAAKPAAPKPAATTETLQGVPWKPDEVLAAKGITVRVGKSSAVCFDTDTLRYAGGWTGGFLDLSKCHLTSYKGSLPAIVQGALLFTTPNAPGWAKGASFADPRATGEGPLPRAWGHYQGLYRDGEKVVFAYTVGDAHVLDSPGLVTHEKHLAFTRTLRVEKSAAPLTLVACAAAGAVQADRANVLTLAEANGERVTCVGVVGAGGARLRVAGASVSLTIPPTAGPASLTLVIASLPKADAGQFPALLAAAGEPADLTSHLKGGPSRWHDPIETAGERGADKGAYTIDTVKLPDANPYGSWMRLGALDFFPDGRCAVATWNGDVWIVSGLDDSLARVSWRRFAAGLYEPLGLKVLGNDVYVLGRDQITRLRDLNGDGEADSYENFNNDTIVNPNYHSFSMDLQADRAGNLYYATAGNQETLFALTEQMKGDVVKVSADGSKSEVFATGFRAANGMGIGYDDQLVVGDNQGHWTPSSKISLVKPGGWYGYGGDPRRLNAAQFKQVLAQHPAGMETPICWIPYGWDNSSGGQLWVEGDKAGPLKGHFLHTSYGKGTVFEVLMEEVDGVAQGGVVQLLPQKFDSGVMRARLNPADGQVYCCGLRGWQTAGAKDGCLQRLRYTGKPFTLPTAMHVTDKGIRLGFDVPLDPETAADDGSYAIEQYVYHWSSTYGSPEYKASDPQVKGKDVVEVKSAKLSADRKSVFLEVPKIKPVMQMVITMDLKTAAGEAVKCQVGGSVNVVGRGGE